MNKKLITLAVAAAMAAPGAALAEATIYGKLHNSIDYVDVDQNAFAFGPATKPGVTGVPISAATQTIPNTIGISMVDPTGTMQTVVLPSNTQQIDNLLEQGYTIRGVNVAVPETVVNPNTGVITTVVPRTRSFKGWDLNANPRSNRIGLKGSEDLGGGLKAIYQVEFLVWLTDSPDMDINNGERGRLQFRNSFVGLAGNFGTFLVGRHDTPLKISTGKLDLFSDTLADYNHTIGFFDVRADNTVAYISPSFSGFQLMGAVIPAGGATPAGAGGSNPLGIGNYDPAAALSESTDGFADAYSIAGIYKNGPFYASLGYENLGEKHWKSTLEGQYVTTGGGIANSYRGIPNYGSAKDWSYWRAGLGVLDWNGFTLTGIYESHDSVLGAPQKSDMNLWQIQAAYSFGNNTLKGMYGNSDTDGCVGLAYSGICSPAIAAATGSAVQDLDFINNRDHDSWAIAFDHNFSKRTRAYVLYTSTSSDQVDSDWSGFSLGMIHKF